MVGKPYGTVRNDLLRAGVKLRNPGRGIKKKSYASQSGIKIEVDLSRLKALRSGGATLAEIEQETGIPFTTVRRHLRRAGVDTQRRKANADV
jgi:hypothetical protein